MTNKIVFGSISQVSVYKTIRNSNLVIPHLKLPIPTARELNLFRICPKSGLFIYTRSLHVTIMSLLHAFVCINTSDSVSNKAVLTFARKCIRLVCTVSIRITKTFSLNSI